MTLFRARTLAEARALMAGCPCDIALANLRLPDGSATELLTCGGEKSNFPLVLLVEQGGEQEAVAATEPGAIDYYVKNGADVSDLPRIAIRCVREWHHIVERERAETIVMQLRDQVHQYRRLVTSGLMERGAAHDIEIAFAPILRCAETALEKIPPHGQARGEIEHVIRITKLARDLVQNAVNHGHTDRGKWSQVDVRQVTNEVLDLLRPVAPAGIEIRLKSTADRTTVVADPAQLKRMVMTLCFNAFEAMRSSGGVLHVDLDTGKSGKRESLEYPYVRLTVTDTGQGMNQDMADRVFDPSFTVEQAAGGIDLGMPLVREIARAHGGDITVESELGKGTVFQVLLPYRV
jgi:signal transduction histidine kinase